MKTGLKKEGLPAATGGPWKWIADSLWISPGPGTRSVALQAMSAAWLKGIEEAETRVWFLVSSV